MIYLHEQMKKLTYDVRLKELNLRRGAISDSEWKKHLSNLPDLKEQTVKVDIEESSSSESAY